MIIRNELHTILSRLEEPRRFIQVLAGPRQVGKTTLVGQLLQRIHVPVLSETADMADPNDQDWIASRWHAARVQLQLSGATEFLLVIDEIQRINNWSEQVKREWDSDTFNHLNIKVVLLGSSRLLLKDGLRESLAGRFELVRIPHWTFAEMREGFGFSLEQYIYFGGYPGAAPLIQNESRWHRYIRDAIIEPAIEKDVLMTKRVLKPALMRQLFEVGCASSGELLSYTKMLGQLQEAGNASTLSNYLYTLGEANLLSGLKKYAVDTVRRYQSIPKMQVFNNSLLTAYKGNGFKAEMMDSRRWGRWVESAVGAYLLNQAEDIGAQVYYWRDRDDEVDFVVQLREKVLAIEVKSGNRAMNSGIPHFRERYTHATTLVVGTGGLPLETFFLSDLEKIMSIL